MSAQALLGALGAGLIAGCGPCAASRVVALLSLACSARRIEAARRAVGFVFGSVAAYASLTGAFEYVVRVATSRELYWILSALALAATVAILVSVAGGGSTCGVLPGRVSPAASFAAGFACSLAGVPCCVPVLGLLAASPAGGANAFAVSATFVCGQMAVPALTAAGVGLSRTSRAWRAGTERAIATVCAGLTLFLSGYYAVLS